MNSVQLCVDMADAFYQIGAYADELDKKFQQQSMQFKRDAFYAFPAIVNVAFACELYLKAIYMCKNNLKSIKGHYLDELFLALPETCQSELSEKFAKQTKYQTTLLDTLKHHKKSLETWRYAFEEENLGITAYPSNLVLAATVLKEKFERITEN